MASYLDENNGVVQHRSLRASSSRLTALLLATAITLGSLATGGLFSPVLAKSKKSNPNENSTVSGTTPDDAALVKETIFCENLEREAYTHIPAGFVRGQRLPAVLVFHGGFNLANRMDTLTGFNQIADQNGFIVCYPQAFKHHWNDGRNIDGHDNYNDEAYAVEVINHLGRKYNIDPTRVYAAGLSNGGFFAQYLALRRPDKVAAIASVAATLPQIIQSTKVPLHPISVLYILGMDDPLMPFDGGLLHYKTFRDKGTVLSAAMSAQYWVQGNHCNPVPTSLDLPDIDATDGCRVKYANFGGGRHGSEVGIFGISGGGHTWPGGLQYAPESQIGKTCRDINASKAMWDFFKNHHN